MNHQPDERIARLTVKEDESIKTAMQAIDNGALGMVLIVDADGKFTGLATDGDVRRAILQGVQIEKPIKTIMNKSPLVIRGKPTDDELLELQNREPFQSKLAIGYSFKIPILDKGSRIRDIALLYHGGKKPSLLSEYEPREWGAVKRVLVIGGAGYLGSVLTRKLLSGGFMVNGLDNIMYGDHGIKELYGSNGFNFIEGDIRDIKVVMEAIKGCDAVIHLAAIVGDPACKLDAEETISINYLATKMIAEVCKYSQINRFIFASTCSVYGANEKPDVLLNEESPLNPVSLYAEMKLKSEKGVLEAMDENFSPTILRMATLYGLSPRMRFDLVVNLFTAQAINKGKITVFGGNQWRPLLHVDDAAEAYLRCLKAPIDKVQGQIFNVGSNRQNYKISELGSTLQRIIPTLEIEYKEDLVDPRNYNVRFDKISKALDYRVGKNIKDAMLEIKQAFDEGIIGDYTDKKYSNYESKL